VAGLRPTGGKGEVMPYKSLSQLPDGVKDNLPKGAQEIYMEAYNSAHKQYKDPDDRRDKASLEETAAKVAWAAVKKKYEKSDDGRWRLKKE
jgi:cation transport regulator